MKKEIAKKWVRALRSKKYKQFKGCLKVTSRTGVDRHCCLGVLCELYQNDQQRNKKQGMAVSVILPDDVPDLDIGVVPKTSVATGFGRNKESQSLPLCVQRWAGIRSHNGRFDFSKGAAARLAGGNNLADLNDNGMPFTKIADLIEERVAEL
jgi:hypothetical protein